MLSRINITVQKPAEDSYEDGGVLLHTTLLFLQFTVMFKFSPVYLWWSHWGSFYKNITLLLTCLSGLFLRCTKAACQFNCGHANPVNAAF